MYESHFGLRELPFCLTPDTQFYLNSTWHAEASTVLDICIQQGEGFLKIVGEVGTGKTMLCRRLLSALPNNYMPIYIPNPYLSPEGLFHAIAHELGIRMNEANSHVVLKIIEDELVQLAVLGHKVILIVDEAQSMPAETLEALRLVTNLETEKFKLLQVVLFGQPELDVILGQPALRQLLQRVTFSYGLQPLVDEEVKDYLTHRLVKAGYSGPELFEPKAIKAITRASGGIPRLINVLAHKAMMCAFGKKANSVNKQFVYAAIDDTESVSRPRLVPFSFGRAAAIGVAVPFAALSVMELFDRLSGLSL
jgi:MSHA biogenesis protein MshM